jgi:HEPN domain-containing protein
MQPGAIREAREWLERADLESPPRRARTSDPTAAGGAAYHAQQAAEKALKAFLAAHNIPFPLTHNLTVLLPLCQALDPTFGQFGVVAATLTPFATQFRYPGGPLEPAIGDAQQRVQDAAGLVSFVRQQLGL